MKKNLIAGATITPVGFGLGAAIAAYQDMLRGRRTLSSIDTDREILEDSNEYLKDQGSIELPSTEIERLKEEKKKKLTNRQQILLEQFGGENALEQQNNFVEDVLENVPNPVDDLKIRDLLNLKTSEEKSRLGSVFGPLSPPVIRWLEENKFTTLFDNTPRQAEKAPMDTVWGPAIITGSGLLSSMLGYGAVSQLLENKRKHDVADEVYNAKREFQKALVYEASQAKRRKEKKSAEEDSELMRAVKEFQDSVDYADDRLKNWYREGCKYAKAHNIKLSQESWFERNTGRPVEAWLGPQGSIVTGSTIGAMLAMILGRRAYLNAKQEQESHTADRLLGLVHSPNDVVDYLSESELLKNEPNFTVRKKKNTSNMQLVE
jgi:hypothetical protein